MKSLINRIAALGLAPALALCMHFEGTFLEPYKDPLGIVTECTGHTGPDVVRGKVNTPDECKEKLLADLVEANAVVDSCITAPLNENQRNALVDFSFNVGPGKRGVKDGLCHLKADGRISTLARLTNAREYTKACHEYPKWDKPRLRGIVARRAAEEALCLKPT